MREKEWWGLDREREKERERERGGMEKREGVRAEGGRQVERERWWREREGQKRERERERREKEIGGRERERGGGVKLLLQEH